MSQSLGVSWPWLGWASEDHGLQSPITARNGAVCMEMLCTGGEAELSIGADPWQEQSRLDIAQHVPQM